MTDRLHRSKAARLRWSRQAARAAFFWAITGLGAARGQQPMGPPLIPPGGAALAPEQMLPPGETLSVQPSAPATGRQLIADVLVKGAKSTKDFKIQQHIHTRKDREFDPELVQSDVRRLVSSGLFRDVRTYTRNTPAGVVVTYEVVERPRIEYIRHHGNRGMSEKKLTKEHAIKVGDPINAYTTEEGRRKIEELYRRGGYPNAQIITLEGDKPGDKGIVYEINEGPIERVSSVSFQGNTIASDARLKTQIESKPGYFYYFFRGKVDREKIASDVEKLTAYYRGLGYFRARVGRELEFDESGKWLNLKFIIDEGPRYVVRNVTIEGNQKFASKPLLDFLELKSGEFYNQAEMNKDINSITDLYGSQGHVFCDVQADPKFLEEPGTLDLVYRVKEGDVFTVGDVNVHIAGEFPHTRDSVVLNRLSLRPGDIIDMRKIRDSERRLKSSQLFEVNPQDGNPPKIVVGTPELNNSSRAMASAAQRSPAVASNGQGQMAVRGQSPDGAEQTAVQHLPPPTYYIPPPTYYAPPAQSQPVQQAYGAAPQQQGQFAQPQSAAPTAYNPAQANPPTAAQPLPATIDLAPWTFSP